MNIRVTIRPTDLPARKAIEQAVERLLAMLDQLDGDTDLEPGNDDEPYLGWTGNGPHRPWNDSDPNRENDDDREHDDCDLEDGHDREREDIEPNLADSGSELEATEPSVW